MALSSKDLAKPIRRAKTVEIEGYGEFIVQSLDLVDRIEYQRKLHENKNLSETELIPWVLHRAVVNPDKNKTRFWSEAEWRDFGSSLDGVTACAKLYGELQRMFLDVEKKGSAVNSKPPSESA